MHILTMGTPFPCVLVAFYQRERRSHAILVEMITELATSGLGLVSGCVVLRGSTSKTQGPCVMAYNVTQCSRPWHELIMEFYCLCSRNASLRTCNIPLQDDNK